MQQPTIVVYEQTRLIRPISETVQSKICGMLFEMEPGTCIRITHNDAEKMPNWRSRGSNITARLKQLGVHARYIAEQDSLFIIHCGFIDVETCTDD